MPEPDEQSANYLSIREASKYLGVSSQTLRRWDAERKLKSIRHPGNGYRYYKRSDLEPLRLDYKRAEERNPGSFFNSSTANIETNDRLRAPQREAHRLVREHFEQKRTPAVVQIPVGCGKTGLIATLPFGISEGRVLVIAPNTMIRGGIAEALEVGNPKFFLGKTNVLSSFAEGPFAAVLDGPQANIHDCTESHYVLTNIQQLASSADRWLPQFPPNFFDMLLVDEGHHNVADSWRKVFDRFPEAKVVSLTATPFRSDGQRVTGDVVYRYSYAKAMLAGYIKQIHSINVAPSEIHFTYQNDARRHTLAEVMELREEAWFRKGVALAPECNISVVDASIQRMRELREKTGQRQQIIAAACSIDHARQIRVLYEQRNVKVRELYSEMDPDQRQATLLALEESRIDCIVQVQMLGEGFDHPPLSVAAIFRPFRSLSPYVQFVGRIMRVMVQDDPGNPANHGYVVSHVGLNNDANWKDFHEFDLADQRVFREWLETQGTDAQPEGQILSDFVRQSFLDPNDSRVVDRILDAVIPGVGVRFGDIMTRDQVQEMLAKTQAKMLGGPPEAIPVSPQKRRQGARKRLADRPRAVAMRVLKELGLAPAGVDLGRLMPEVTGSKNMVAMIRLIHKGIDARLGIGRDQRNGPSANAGESAMDQIDGVGDEVRDRIRLGVCAADEN